MSAAAVLFAGSAAGWIDDGKVVVDFGTCANPRGTYPLLKFESWEGPDPELVIEGEDPGNVVLVRTVKQLAVKVHKGLLLIVR